MKECCSSNRAYQFLCMEGNNLKQILGPKNKPYYVQLGIH